MNFLYAEDLVRPNEESAVRDLVGDEGVISRVRGTTDVAVAPASRELVEARTYGAVGSAHDVVDTGRRRFVAGTGEKVERDCTGPGADGTRELTKHVLVG